MANDYIRKQDAVGAVEFGITLASAINIETGERTELFQRENDELREAVKRINDIEPADVAPVVHGKWEDKEVIHKKCIEEWQSARCSACGKYHTTPYMYYFDDFKFCPNCGADMRGEQDG